MTEAQKLEEFHGLLIHAERLATDAIARHTKLGWPLLTRLDAMDELAEFMGASARLRARLVLLMNSPSAQEDE